MCTFDSLHRSLLALPIVLVATSARADDATPTKGERDLGLGLIVGATSGFGLNLRADLDANWGASLSALGYGKREWAMWSTGLEITRKIWSKQRLRAYAVAGANYLGANAYYPKPFAGQKVRRHFQALAFGAGLGVETRVGPFGFLFELPLTGIAALTPDTDLRFPGRVNFGLFPNFAACFYFGAHKRMRRSRANRETR